MPRGRKNNQPLTYPVSLERLWTANSSKQAANSCREELVWITMHWWRYCQYYWERDQRSVTFWKWTLERKYRFTAYLISHRQRSHDKFVQEIMCPKTFHSRHTAPGIKYEPVAINIYHKYMYSQKHQCMFTKVDLSVCTNSPILGCSPDGKVIDPNCDPFGLLEVKCPETKFQVSPRDACSDPKFFCERVGNVCKLKRTHAYYAQAQGQMGCTGARWCDFVNYTKKGMSIERITFDRGYWVEL